jgi:hypothetical protein
MICAYSSCAFRKAERQVRRRPYSTLAPYAPPLRAALGAAMTDTSTRRARRCTRRWTLWDTCSPCWSLRPQSRSGAGAGSGGRVGGSCARGYRRVGRTGIRRSGLRWGTTGRRSSGSWPHAMRLEVVKHEEAKRGFVLLPRRWVVERDFAWASRFRGWSRITRGYPIPWLGCTSSRLLVSSSSRRPVSSVWVHNTL